MVLLETEAGLAVSDTELVSFAIGQLRQTLWSSYRPPPQPARPPGWMDSVHGAAVPGAGFGRATTQRLTWL